jgi:hypothetical protein
VNGSCSTVYALTTIIQEQVAFLAKENERLVLLKAEDLHKEISELLVGGYGCPREIEGVKMVSGVVADPE